MGCCCECANRGWIGVSRRDHGRHEWARIRDSIGGRDRREESQDWPPVEEACANSSLISRATFATATCRALASSKWIIQQPGWFLAFFDGLPGVFWIVGGRQSSRRCGDTEDSPKMSLVIGKVQRKNGACHPVPTPAKSVFASRYVEEELIRIVSQPAMVLGVALSL